jgi:enoyl-CoA hydratase
MLELLWEQLLKWNSSDSIKCVFVTARDECKAFCAGGDIKFLHGLCKSGDLARMRKFFDVEYNTNRMVKRFSKPYVAFWDGIAMGGGVGISIHGIPLLTERTIFSMPETHIGLFPDVAAGYFLSRCKNEALGLYIGLLGIHCNAAECVTAGIGAAVIASASCQPLKQLLRETPPSSTEEFMQMIEKFTVDVASFSLPNRFVDHAEEIKHAFDSKDSFVDIMDALIEMAHNDSSWAEHVLLTLRRLPTRSLEATFRQLKAGKTKDFEEVQKMEYALMLNMMPSSDFENAVYTKLIAKTGAPVWMDCPSMTEIEALFQTEGKEMPMWPLQTAKL